MSGQPRRSEQRCGIAGCRNRIAHWRDGLCESHARSRARELQAQRVQRGIRETGRERVQTPVTVAEIELTDGQMQWWVTASAWGRRGWRASRREAA